MTSFDFDKTPHNILSKNREQDLECISCPRCSGQWFTQVECQRFEREHNVVLGQPAPGRAGGVPYMMLSCVHCNKLISPSIIHASRDVARGDYDHFLDTLEGKFDKRVKKEPEKVEPKTVETSEV